MAEVTLQEAAQGALVEKKGNFKPGDLAHRLALALGRSAPAP